MADDAASPDPTPERELEAGPLPSGSWVHHNRALALALGCVALCGVIAVDVYVMVVSDARRGAVGLGKASANPLSTGLPPAPGALSIPSAAPRDADDDAVILDYESDDGEPHHEKPTPPRRFDTVQHAAIDSCTTASVDGLSRQIIAQARCTKPNAFVPLPSRPNLVVASQVFPYLELEARNRLLKALDARPRQKMTINSALRTVAQQYLVWRWSATRRCGVPLATPPGQSNHEIGVALDIAEAATWRPALEAEDFKWLGASDRVHFDYKSSSTAGRTAVDVLAFQKLWNKNHPTDKIAEDGRYSPATENRLKQAPADGFASGPSCTTPATR